MNRKPGAAPTAPGSKARVLPGHRRTVWKGGSP
jgi:hypothetical protein